MTARQRLKAKKLRKQRERARWRASLCRQVDEWMQDLHGPPRIDAAGNKLWVFVEGKT